MRTPESILEISSYQELCLSNRSRKVQRLWGFNSAAEVYFKNATDGLDWGEAWNLAISACDNSLQIRMFFLTRFSLKKHFVPTLAPLFFYEMKFHAFPREDDFGAKWNLMAP